MDRLDILLHFKSFIVHMFYGLNFSDWKYLTIMLMKGKYYLYDDDNATVFDWGDS